MGISYGNPENRVLHYKRPHLKLNVQTFQVAPVRENAPKESVHYVYLCKKLEGAEQVSEENWPHVEAQIKKEELDEENILYDSEDDEEETK